MDLLELEAVLGLNTQPYIKGLNMATDLFGDLASLVAKGLTTTISVVWDFTTDVFETGLEFDKAMSGVYAVTQASDEGVQSLLKNAAVAEAQMSAFTTAEVAMAEYYEGLAGYDVTEITEGLHGIVVTAEAAGESLPKIADILTDTVRAFGDSAGEQKHYGDVLAATATSTNTTITKMGDALKYVAPLAGALGYQVEDVAISLGIMADRGTKASQAGTTLRNIFTRIATNAGATNKDLGALDILVDKLGVSFYDSEKNARPWLEVVEDCRTAWQGLNDQDRDTVLDGFAQLAVGGKDADEVLKNLTKSGEEANVMLGKLQSTKDADEQKKYGDSIRGIASSYSVLFDLLGMKVDPANDDLISLTNAFDQARIKLSGLSDQEQIYFSKQIGSLRGATGWLELMNATDESFNNVKEAILGADGAADEMVNIRRGSTLYSDVQQFNSALDALKTNIYNVITGPLRPFVQWATDALRDISDAIGANGLQGGLDMLELKLEELGNDEELQKVIQYVGNLAGTVFNGIFGQIIPAIGENAPKALQSFIDGLNKGAGTTSIGEWIGNLFENLGNDEGFKRGLDSFGRLLGGSVDSFIDEALPKLEANAPKIIGAFLGGTGEGLTGSGNPLTGLLGVVVGSAGGLFGGAGGIIGYLFSNGDVEKQRREIANSLTDTVTPEVKEYAAGEFSHTMSDDWETAELTDKMFNSISTGGTDGAATAGENAKDIMSTSGTEIANDLENQIGDAGIPAGAAFGNNIQSMLNSRSFVMDIVANIIGLPGGATIRQNASAMNPGRIFTKPTIFGYANGAYQVAGDAGPEAVVGTNSLQRMIQGAVYSAIGPQTFSVPRNTDRPINIVFEVDGAQKWIYRLNKLEEQRVGLKLNGGVL